MLFILLTLIFPNSVFLLDFAPTPFSRINKTSGTYVNVKTDERITFQTSQNLRGLRKSNTKIVFPKHVASGSILSFEIHNFINIETDYITIYVSPVLSIHSKDIHVNDYFDIIKLSECELEDINILKCNVVVMNYRIPYDFRYINVNGDSQAFIITQAELKLDAEIQHVHIGRTEKDDEMMIMFTLPNEDYLPIVYVRGDDEENFKRFVGIAHTFTEENMCSEPAGLVAMTGLHFRYPGYQASVRVSGLRNDQKYVYYVSGEGHDNKINSELKFFHAPPRDGDTSRSMKIIMLADQVV